MDLADLSARGLYDPAAPDANERRALLEFLLEQGVTPDEIEVAEGEGRLASIFTDRIIGRPCWTLEEVAARAEQPAELLARVWRAAGFPDPEPGTPVFTESDAEALTVFGFAVRLFGEQPALQLTRVMGSSAARMAEAELAVAIGNVEGAYFPTAASPLDAMRTSAGLISLLPASEQAIAHLLRRHLIAANRRFETSRLDPTDAERIDVAVGFADLTGSTSLSTRLSANEYARALAEFEATASDLVVANGGRVVKLIGDEVMFVAPDFGGGCRAALDLVAAVDDHDVLPRLRAAVTAGMVVVRDGDYFGPVVNLAARLVALAAPGTVLVPEVALEPSGGLTVEPLGTRDIRGFEAPVAIARVTRV